jgi:triphosphoribosyl-dephospho-CoA synthase
MTRQLDYLEARDARHAQLQRAFTRLGPADSILFLGANIPGPDKALPGLAGLLRSALNALPFPVRMFHSGWDCLGPYHLARVSRSPRETKLAALVIEEASPSGRLLDLDVYGPDGLQVGRTALGIPPRPCLLCEEAAMDCIRLQRHSPAELRARVEALLKPYGALPERIHPERLAENLVRGAQRELDLTPKPGLVDRQDCGSHPDLSYAAMRASIGLLPTFFEAILACSRRRGTLRDFTRIGIEAEARMNLAIQTNAHRGYLFLAGLLLMAALEVDGEIVLLREAIARIAEAFFAQDDPRETPGARVRNRFALGGILGEARHGLPAVFTHGWPRFREMLSMGGDPEWAAFYTMGHLMQRVEDTTAVRRCGMEGLTRLRTDGETIQRSLERGQAPEPLLAALNEEYRAIGLTMGGVADCLALVFALEDSTLP